MKNMIGIIQDSRPNKGISFGLEFQASHIASSKETLLMIKNCNLRV